MNTNQRKLVEIGWLYVTLQLMWTSLWV